MSDPSVPLTEDRPRYLAQIDGLRAIAVTGVVWSHAGPLDALGGFGKSSGLWGVELFFVISGFLITSILIRSVDKVPRRDRFSILKPFYIRRSLRIWPAYYATIVLGLILAFPATRQTLFWDLPFLSNLQIARTDQWPPLTGHFWSLAVEEQFYLIWPPIFLATPARFRFHLGLLITAIGPISGWFAFERGGLDAVVDTSVQFYRLGLGAVFAMLIHGASARRRSGVSAVWLQALAVGVSIVLLGRLLVSGDPTLEYTLRSIGWGLIMIGVLAFAELDSDSHVGRFLAIAPLRYLGRISYGVYLYHFMALLLVRYVLSVGDFDVSYTVFVLTMGLSVVMAAASWHLFERPINGLKHRFPYTPKATRVAKMSDS